MNEHEECLGSEAVVAENAVTNSAKYVLHDMACLRGCPGIQNLNDERKCAIPKKSV